MRLVQPQRNAHGGGGIDAGTSHLDHDLDNGGKRKATATRRPRRRAATLHAAALAPAPLRIEL